MTWQKQSIGNLHLPLVGFGGNCFLGVGKKNVAHVSENNGIDWNQYVIDSTSDWGPIIRPIVRAAFGNGTWFVYVAQAPSKYFTSTDNGKTWSVHRNSNNYRFGEVVFANSKFIAIEHLGNRCVTSIDGVQWTPQSLPDGMTAPGAEPLQIAKGQNSIVVTKSPRTLGSGPARTWFALSSDGVSWSRSDPLPFPCRPNLISYSNLSKRFVSLVHRISSTSHSRKLEVIKSDDDGQTWQAIQGVTIPPPTGSNRWDFKFVFGNGRFILLPPGHTSTRYPTTVNGENWQTEDLLCVRLDRIQFGNNSFVATGPNGILVTGS